MAYVITQRCCNDASCVAECPVDCIRPRPEDPEFQSAEMLYIDPQTCIDCGACFEACPVEAIYAEDDLPTNLTAFADINASYFDKHPLDTDVLPMVKPPKLAEGKGPLRVAIVGTGPAACYAAEDLLSYGAVEVEMFDRLPSPWGLLRYGVAPDHAKTRGVADAFLAAFKRDALQFHLNVEVGRHISHAELLSSCHAVVYAVGASRDRTLNIPGEDLAGSHSATEFVAWYNGHPDYADRAFDLRCERAVVIGNGNVALDVARVLTLPPDELAKTDIADHALETLRSSSIREVVVLGRRGPLQAGYTSAELLALGRLPGVDVVVDPAVLELDPADVVTLDSPDVSHAVQTKWQLLNEHANRPLREGNRRIILGFWSAPTALIGSEHVEAVEFVHTEPVRTPERVTARPTERSGTIAAGLVLRAVGYRGEPVPGLPFDESRAVVPNVGGRVVDGDGIPLTGVYTSGWIKRGPRGVIGSNRVDAAETVRAIVEDFHAGRLLDPVLDRAALTELVHERQPDVVDRTGWQAIDSAERAAGATQGRPRKKFTALDDFLSAARGR
ncbi:FAD-dependent oxidoreductase [Nocardia sp. NPDC004654]|uniref:FAD-dependent oxidoreductase n=1 Tax=Nocardia sp. NPDC004654 TaxID=3154776 RepID=UPI00339F142F